MGASQEPCNAFKVFSEYQSNPLLQTESLDDSQSSRTIYISYKINLPFCFNSFNCMIVNFSNFSNPPKNKDNNMNYSNFATYS